MYVYIYIYIYIYKCIIIILINFVVATIPFVLNVAGDFPDLQTLPKTKTKTKQIVTTNNLIIIVIIIIKNNNKDNFNTK